MHIARRQHSEGTKTILARIDKALPAEWLRQTAQEVGLVKRLRSFDPVLLFWMLVLRSGIHLQNSIEALRRAYNTHAEHALAYSSFYERFRPELVKFLHACVLRAIEQLSQLSGRTLSPRLARFKDIMIQDSTIIRVHEKLAQIWPATRSRKIAAGVKVATLVSVVSTGPARVELFGERTAEIKTLKLGPWVKDRLLLIDLGFQDYGAFARILRHGGSFVSRLKARANPFIVKQLKTVRGNSINVEGERLQDVLGRLKREVLDVVVEVAFRRRTYAGSRTGDTIQLRMIAIRNDETGEYHTYVTNLGPEDFEPEDISSLYGSRWEVELVFKQMKSQFGIDVLPTANPDAVRAMIWTGILTTVVHRIYFLTVCELKPDRAHGYSYTRSTKMFREQTAQRIFEAILDYQKVQYDFWDIEEFEDCGGFHAYRENDTHLQEWSA